MATDYELTIPDYIAILRRRAAYLILIFLTTLVITILVALVLPPSYLATGTILVETPQVLERADPRAVRVDLDERINVIKQRVMTRESLLQIINRHSLFSESAGSLTTTELIEKMRSRISVESFNSSMQRQQVSAFTVSYEDGRPEIALQVTNDLVALFLDWNIKLRTEGAMETTEFFVQESDKLKAEVDKLEAKIAAYKRQNSNNLPEQLNLRTTIMSRAENDLYSVERDIRSGNEELRALEAELSVARHGISSDTTQTLPALRAEYTRLSAIYTESHPDLRAIKRKIEALEQGANAPPSNNPAGNITNLAAFTIQARIDAVNARMESLKQQKQMLQDKIRQNEHAMELTPKVAQGLDILIRDRDSAQRKFDELRNKRMNAQIAQSLESENMSERFVLLEPPILPEKPFKPNRVKILVLGMFLAVAAAFSVVMLLESMDKRVRGVEALTHVLGARPLAVIPYLQLESEKGRSRNMNVSGIVRQAWSRVRAGFAP